MSFFDYDVVLFDDLVPSVNFSLHLPSHPALVVDAPSLASRCGTAGISSGYCGNWNETMIFIQVFLSFHSEDDKLFHLH